MSDSHFATVLLLCALSATGEGEKGLNRISNGWVTYLPIGVLGRISAKLVVITVHLVFDRVSRCWAGRICRQTQFNHLKSRFIGVELKRLSISHSFHALIAILSTT
ncbi:hypothetical protein [Veronia nyctiphanis]|uniref:hypothetical protein n=1 Tax=Veronia nyctiphanis TaxID=1278244 RepID=UPI00100A4999|nr:hypothetical protein [Veronia nyctiphanis]